jgi:hypothetical protein
MKGNNNGKSKSGKEKIKGNINGRHNGKSKEGKSTYHYIRKRIGMFDRG